MTLWRYFWASPNTFIGLAVVPFVLATRGRIQVIDGVLEAYGGLLPWLLRRAIPLPGGAEAITLGHVVLARDREVLDATRAHERVHVRQYETWGPAFIPAYFLASLWAGATRRRVYEDNCFERQARREAQLRRHS